MFSLFFTLLIINCKSNDAIKSDEVNNKFKESKKKFKEEKDRFNKCKNEYEKLNGYKIVIDVRNGSGVPGLAKKVSNHLRDLCYDTYYDNWSRSNQYYSKIILHKQDETMRTQLKRDLDNKIKLGMELAPNKEADITLVIGQNYKELDFFKEIKQ
tara:strand:+ start:126 stop:590 length:465 start_codon:yes stop_codon:yes gene_type:complete